MENQTERESTMVGEKKKDHEKCNVEHGRETDTRRKGKEKNQDTQKRNTDRNAEEVGEKDGAKYEKKKDPRKKGEEKKNQAKNKPNEGTKKDGKDEVRKKSERHARKDRETQDGKNDDNDEIRKMSERGPTAGKKTTNSEKQNRKEHQKDNKVLFILRSFSNEIQPERFRVLPNVTLNQILTEGARKFMGIEAVAAYKALENNSNLVPFLEHMPIEEEMTLFLQKPNEEIPPHYRVLNQEELPDLQIEAGQPVGLDSTEICIEQYQRRGIVVVRGNSASVQFEKGQAGRIIGRDGSIIQGLRAGCPGASIEFDEPNCMVNISADQELHLEHAIKFVLKERLGLKSFGLIRHPQIREFKVRKGGFGPVMGVDGEIKHEIESKYSVRLKLDHHDFVVRIIGANSKSVNSAFEEVFYRFTKKFPIKKVREMESPTTRLASSSDMVDGLTE